MRPRKGVLLLLVLGVTGLGACATSGSADFRAPAASLLTASTAQPQLEPSSTAISSPPGSKPLPTTTARPRTTIATSTRTSLEAQDAGVSTPTPVINPLTGLPAPDPALLNRRPLAVKISNYPRDIRPQFGLNEADVVFEYYIEWGYTRFIGIFYGRNAQRIGPVRSGRYFDEHITRMYQAFYVFNFADPREYRYFLGGDLATAMIVPGGNCSVSPFFTSRGSAVTGDASHYECYFDSTRFDEYLARKPLDNSRRDLPRTYFSDRVPAGGVDVRRIYTYFSRCDYNYWEYDPDSSTYSRYQETSPSKDERYINECADDPQTYSPLVDAIDHKQVVSDNVVVLYVSHTFANENEQSDEIYHIDLIDSGRAFVFRDGVAVPARWVRTDIGRPLVLTTPAGDPLGLRPGRTFFEVIGETSHDWSDGDDWHFDFHTP